MKSVFKLNYAFAVVFALLQVVFVESVNAQNPENEMLRIADEISIIDSVKSVLTLQFNDALCTLNKDKLKEYGLPSMSFQEHKAYFFEYSEDHEQSKWVAHVIHPKIVELGSGRTNDFRVDPLVQTGTADSIDYYAYDGTKPEDQRYTGYGYDRGHLAPSADFRWSKEALSESYYYSNISPQHADLNRESWADLEGLLRKYVLVNKVSLAVVTMPILTEDLKKIKQSPNGVSVPRQFVKVAYDAVNGRSIAFVMENQKLTEPLSYYSMSVDEAEKITGYNYFPLIDESIEDSIDKLAWFDDEPKGDVEAMDQSTLPMKYFNTSAGVKQAKSNKIINVCGTVVDTRYSRKGHAWLNLDKKYPNQVFSIMIRKDELVNFPFDPILEYAEQQFCFEGKVEQWGDIIVMQVRKPELVTTLD